MKHTRMQKTLIGALVGMTLAAAATQANAAYTFTDLGTLGGTNSYAYGINDVGQVVGYSYASSYTSRNASGHAFLWDGGSMTDLGIHDGTVFSAAYGINNDGLVVGYTGSTAAPNAAVWWGSSGTGILSWASSNASDINNSWNVVGSSQFSAKTVTRHAALFDWAGGGELVDLGSLGGTNSHANSINDVGQVAGHSQTTGNAATHATLWDITNYNNSGLWTDITMTDLGTLGGTNSYAYSTNNVGQVVGVSQITGNAYEHATLWNAGTMTDLGTLGGMSSYAYAINDFGQVVGASTTTNSVHATLWDGGTLIDLNSVLDARAISAGWVLNEARDINKNGWIVGTASNSLLGVSGHAFLLAPVPEPETYAMLLAGLGLTGFAARRRRMV